MATLLKVLNNLADIKSAGGLHFASELRPRRLRAIIVEIAREAQLMPPFYRTCDEARIAGHKKIYGPNLRVQRRKAAKGGVS